MGGDDNVFGDDGPGDVDGFWVDGVFYALPGALFGTTVGLVKPDQSVSNAAPGNPAERGFSTNGPPQDGDTRELTKPVNPGGTQCSSWIPKSEFLSDPNSTWC